MFILKRYEFHNEILRYTISRMKINHFIFYLIELKRIFAPLFFKKWIYI